MTGDGYPPRAAGQGEAPQQAAAAEAALLARARQGDREAFEALVRGLWPALVRFCHGLAGRDRGLDLAQEALLRALRGIRSFRGEASFRSWVFRIARNAWINERALLRSRTERSAGETVLDRAAATESPSAAEERRELVAEIERALAQLPEEQRTALLLCDREGLSYKEIAEAMGTPIGTVMSRIHYARTKLRRMLAHLARR
ncbi:MAG: RNA polymerase sigma factor RpoE [Planctomycetota bacterium]|nr:MAG: RNA polymerase sigma factor RpoE [Planctomycetota bacterium]